MDRIKDLINMCYKEGETYCPDHNFIVDAQM